LVPQAQIEHQAAAEMLIHHSYRCKDFILVQQLLSQRKVWVLVCHIWLRALRLLSLVTTEMMVSLWNLCQNSSSFRVNLGLWWACSKKKLNVPRISCDCVSNAVDVVCNISLAAEEVRYGENSELVGTNGTWVCLHGDVPHLEETYE